MARVKEKKVLEKKGWVQNFILIGKACVNDYTFKIDEHSDKSDWIYNVINLDVDCGEKYGKVRSELMGGYGAGRDNVCYVHGKKDDGTDDFDNQYRLDWDDRFNEEYLKDIGDLCFINIGIEKDTKGNVVVSKFLQQYDAIKYLSNYLTNDMEIKVRGQLRYSMYQGNVQVKKEINSIYLKKEDEKYMAAFTQTLLIDKYSVGKPDKDKCVFPITGCVLEKFKEYNGNDLTDGGKVKGGKFVPLRKGFEYEYDPDTDTERVKKGLALAFKAKKGYSQITYEGIFVEGGAVVQATEADLTDEIKELIAAGLYDMDEALSKCTENKGKDRRMIIKRPLIKLVGEEGSKVPQVQIIENKYSEEDLQLDYLIAHEDEDIEEDVDVEDQDEISDEDEDWMKQLGM